MFRKQWCIGKITHARRLRSCGAVAKGRSIIVVGRREGGIVVNDAVLQRTSRDSASRVGDVPTQCTVVQYGEVSTAARVSRNILNQCAVVDTVLRKTIAGSAATGRIIAG